MLARRSSPQRRERRIQCAARLLCAKRCSNELRACLGSFTAPWKFWLGSWPWLRSRLQDSSVRARQSNCRADIGSAQFGRASGGLKPLRCVTLVVFNFGLKHVLTWGLGHRSLFANHGFSNCCGANVGISHSIRNFVATFWTLYEAALRLCTICCEFVLPLWDSTKAE